MVNAIMGGAGIIGGIIVSTGKVKTEPAKMIYLSATFFLLGDVTMGMGRNVFAWGFAAFAASFPIAFINAGQMTFLYRDVPEEMQGAVGIGAGSGMAVMFLCTGILGAVFSFVSYRQSVSL